MAEHATAKPRHPPNGDFDVELMLRTKAGDEAAFSTLFERYSKRLVTFAYRMVRDRHRAEDLVQDAFLRIYRARDRYAPSARFSTYIYRVVTNSCLNEIRRLNREKPLPEQETRSLADEAATVEPDDEVNRRQLIARMASIVRALPPNQRAALLLTRLEGLDHGQAASCLEVSEFAVKSLVFRATRTLREALQEDGVARSTTTPKRNGPSHPADSYGLGRATLAWLETGLAH